jgi:aryl-alcohol dehydrogenase-like predicted oxidoreductase
VTHGPRAALTDESVGTIKIGDRTVRRLGFGAMRITGPGIWGPPADQDGAIAVLRRAVELGVNLIDTADSYGPEVSEELIAEALYPYPEDLLIATKGGLLRTGPGRWPADGRPEHLREACEGSLRRLRVEAIDLYQHHRPDPRVPYEESIGALKQLQDAGKIRHIGVSNVSVEQLETARRIVEIVSVQNRFNLTDRHSQDVLERCEELGIAFFPWAPIAAGGLAEADGPVDRIAAEHDASPGQVVLAWLLGRSRVIVPIPGTSAVEHLEENLAAASVQLSENEVAELESAAG